LWLEFCECVDIFANNLLYKPMVKELVELAALHLLIAVKKEGGSAKQRLKAKLEEFYPPRFASVMKPSVAMEQIAINFNDIKLISLDKAQQGTLPTSCCFLSLADSVFGCRIHPFGSKVAVLWY
jgi:hypothetical protein